MSADRFVSLCFLRRAYYQIPVSLLILLIFGMEVSPFRFQFSQRLGERRQRRSMQLLKSLVKGSNIGVKRDFVFSSNVSMKCAQQSILELRNDLQYKNIHNMIRRPRRRPRSAIGRK